MTPDKGLHIIHIIDSSALWWNKYKQKESKGWITLKWQILWETDKFQVSFCSPFKFVRRFFVEKKNELQRPTKVLISLRGRAGESAPLLFAHILRRVFSEILAIDQAQVALLLYGELFNGVLFNIHTLKHLVYFCARMNTKLNSSQSQFL